MEPEHLYRVSGTDARGDVHTFATDDLQRAKKVKRQMFEDLGNVTFDEGLFQGPAPSPLQARHEP
jgi:hypothetical protein